MLASWQMVICFTMTSSNISAKKSDGTYDFHENFEYVKPWLKQADLVLGDFEGTVNKDHYLAGYPLFNAPGEVMDAIKDAGYQVLDLAHNHILDSQIEGVFSTADAIEKAGMTPIGVYTHEPRDKAAYRHQGSQGHKKLLF